MLNFSNVSLRRGTKLLFADANFSLHAGYKVALTGANGTGKSSLFALIMGTLHCDSGDVNVPSNLRLAHVAQETPALARSALEYTLDGDADLRRIEAELAAAELQHEAGADNGEDLAHLHGEYDFAQGYTATSRAITLLHGLGFAPGDEYRQITEFSGGWRMRLNLAQALMCRSDILLLDEPTNHLDLEATLWLEEWLRRYPGMLLLISHDREFMDRIVAHVLHIEDGQVKLSKGNYSEVERARAAQLAQQQANFERQQRETAHIRSYVERFRAKASKARQAQSRLKALARMEIIQAAQVNSPFHFSLAQPAKLPSPLLRLSDATLGYGDKHLLHGVNLTLNPGDRVGLLGPNGAGKSTLIKSLAGELPLCAGIRHPAQHLCMGYFAQHQLEQLHPARSPLDHLKKIDPRAMEQQLRTFLGGFGFSGDQARADVSTFSGGERARLVLALLVYQRPNLLLLDEPTNHLDIEMRQALVFALQDYDGAIVLISHDRHLLRTVTDKFLIVHDGSVQDFAGDLEEYARFIGSQIRAREQQEALATAKGKSPALNPAPGKSAQRESAAERQARKRQQAEARRELAPLRAALVQVEKRMSDLTRRKPLLEAALADPTLYEAGNKSKLDALLAEQFTLAKECANLEARWLELTEAETIHAG
jgi:ATP-binding cassette subfamily F protein 3